MAPRIGNFGQWARHILERLGQEAGRDPGGRARALLAELGGYLSGPDRRAGAGDLGFAVPLRLLTSRGELRLVTTVTTFATAVDVTVAELKLEAFLPADRATAAALARPGGAGG
jgi:MmyB-like transcription regulator ligand binding domain